MEYHRSAGLESRSLEHLLCKPRSAVTHQPTSARQTRPFQRWTWEEVFQSTQASTSYVIMNKVNLVWGLFVQVRIMVLAAAKRWHFGKAQEKAKCIRNSLQHTWTSNNMQPGTKAEMVVSYSPSTHSMDLPWGFRLVQYHFHPFHIRDKFT